MEATSSGFRKELVSKLLHLHFKDDKTKVGGDALLLMAELLKIFVLEAAIRSIRQAQAEDLAGVDVEQLEKVLPQLPPACLHHSPAPCPRVCCGIWLQTGKRLLIRGAPPAPKLGQSQQMRSCPSCPLCPRRPGRSRGCRGAVGPW
ncbi:PREDICTED: centromere protein X isoform X2 [Hipposideros armiger]|uniref:Centromere protein X n=1 Tax=Hipposideros armiger TaxID=186990 RepID=A0A8B7SVQ0_HIPAR|nr:PREDICTED: centromere protein X isoform X2 [Hipposideros armiger]